MANETNSKRSRTKIKKERSFDISMTSGRKPVDHLIINKVNTMIEAAIIFFVVGMAFNLEGSNQWGSIANILYNDFAKNSYFAI
ncbi:MAG: hypothetical protein IPL46_13525 [Saprospiraceae bacterium]|nr:hypothetical protein [Saprospiraceae bacterium]